MHFLSTALHLPLLQTMLEDKLRETDWELTQDTIEEQVARESYLQWLKEQDKFSKMSESPVCCAAALLLLCLLILHHLKILM